MVWELASQFHLVEIFPQPHTMSFLYRTYQRWSKSAPFCIPSAAREPSLIQRRPIPQQQFSCSLVITFTAGNWMKLSHRDWLRKAMENIQRWCCNLIRFILLSSKENFIKINRQIWVRNVNKLRVACAECELCQLNPLDFEWQSWWSPYQALS